MVTKIVKRRENCVAMPLRNFLGHLGLGLNPEVGECVVTSNEETAGVRRSPGVGVSGRDTLH